MIRVNLLKNKGESGRTSVETEIDFEKGVEKNTEFKDPQNTPSSLAIKLGLLAAGVAGLMIYESYNIGNLQSQLTTVNAQKNQLTKEIEQKKALAESAKEQQKKNQELEARIKAIKGLSKYRLREIKAIDYIQNNIPERVWVKSLEFKEDTIIIEGGALTDAELNKFLDSLEGRSVFRNVILLKAVEERKKEGSIKNFQISSNIAGIE